MSRIFDHAADEGTDLQELGVHFTTPEAGWVRLKITPLHELYALSCTNIWDPFPSMIEWLERIAGGFSEATWTVNQEGSLARLQFYAGCELDEGRGDFLLHVQTDHRGIARIRGVRVGRRQLVGAFYPAFRVMVERPDYQARDWEMHPQFALLDDLDDDEHAREISRFPYGGSDLRALTSATLEAYIAGQN